MRWGRGIHLNPNPKANHMTKKPDPQFAESLETLRSIINPGDTINCIIRSVARSGMSRRIDFYINQSGVMSWITPHVLRLGVMDETHKAWRNRGEPNGAYISGCGMDMCFESVYRLGRVLFPQGFAVDGRGRNGDMSGHDNDGGYALKNRTI